MPPTNPYAHPHTKGLTLEQQYTAATFDYCPACEQRSEDCTCGGGVVMGADRADQLAVLLRAALPFVTEAQRRGMATVRLVQQIRVALDGDDG